MKKVAKKVAMLLILVMIASSFTGCFTIWAVTGEPPIGGTGYEILLYILVLPADIPIAGTILIVRAGIKAARNKRGKAMEGIDTFSAHISSLPETEFDSLVQAFDSLPEAELASLEQTIDSLTKTELGSFAETMNSFSETEFSAIITTFNNLSEAEIISSIKTLNSMSEESLITMLNNLQHK